MDKIIILQGPPASGKSTWTKEYLEGLSDKERKETIVINRDSIRMSTGTYWVPNREDYITEIENKMITSAMEHHFNIVSDNTNLNPNTIKHLEDLASQYKYNIEYKQFYIPFKEALERDGKRENPVGKKVIENFYLKYFEKEYREEVYVDKRLMPKRFDGSLPTCIICDLDGTIAIHKSGRSPFEYERAEEDAPYMPLVNLLKHLATQNIKLIFITGREFNAGKDKLSTTHSINWLNKYFKGIDFGLMMRSNGDKRPDNITKKELYDKYIKGKYNVMAIFEDRDKVVKMWRELELPCYQTWYGDF